MPAQLKGHARLRNGKWSARIMIGRRRSSIAMTTCKPEEETKAAERAELLASTAKRLVAAGHAELADGFLERIGGRDGRALDDVLTAIERLCAGEATPPISAATTFREFGEQWTSGKLSERWPDHVKRKSTAKEDAQRLELYVYPHIGSFPLPEIELKHAEMVMSALPGRLTPASRRHVAQVIARVMKLAAYPARIISSSPIPAGFLPSVGRRKALTFLYPDEDRALMKSDAVPLAHRILYGFLTREGMRKGEAASLSWADVDLERGAVRLDENKTDDPRAWALDPGVARALVAWKALRKPRRESVRVFVDEAGDSTADRGDNKECPVLREHLKLAGVDRAELFERSEVRQPLRMHDLRATFVTIALANGRSETWVADRTGHASSQMINRYRRAARTVAELGLGELEALDKAIPELRSDAPTDGPTTPVPPRPGITDVAPDVAPRSIESVGIRAFQDSSIAEKAIWNAGLTRVGPGMGHEGLEPSANGLRVPLTVSHTQHLGPIWGYRAVARAHLATSGATSGALRATSIVLGAIRIDPGDRTVAEVDLEVDGPRILNPRGYPQTPPDPCDHQRSRGQDDTDRDGVIHIRASSAHFSGFSNGLDRGHLIRLLGALIGSFASSSDLHSARVLHEALGRLLDAPAAPGEQRAEVVDLNDRRKP